MKKKLMVGIIALISMGVINAQTSIGLKGGLNLSNLSKEENGNFDKNKSLSTFNVGLVAEYGLGDFFAIRTGLDLQGKGAKLKEFEVLGKTYRETVNPLYVELPVNFVAKIPLGMHSKSHFFVGAGPYAAVGVAGKYTSEIIGVDDSKTTKDIEWDNENAQSGSGLNNKMKRFDAGANVIAGFRFGKLGINAQYGVGFIKTQSGTKDEISKDPFAKGQNRTLGVSLAFYFR